MPETTYMRNLTLFTNGIDPQVFGTEAQAASGIGPNVVGIPYVTVESDIAKVKITFDDILTGPEEAVLADVIAAHSLAPETPLEQTYFQQEFTLANSAEQVLNHSADLGANPRRRIDVWKQQPALGTNLAAAMTPVDVDFSSNEVNLNDGNPTSFAYNNLIRNPAGKSFVLDAGAPVTANTVRWYDYTTDAYGPSSYKIQGSNNNTDWTDLASFASDIPHMPPTTDGHLIDLGGDRTYRYWRWLCVVGRNANYIIVNEFEIYNVPAGPPPWVPARSDALIQSRSAGQTVIQNVSGHERAFLVTIMVPRGDQ